MDKPSIPEIIISWGVEATSGYNDGWIMGHYRDKLIAVRDYIDNLLQDPSINVQDESYVIQQNESFIYESPDGGQTVYRRKIGSADRELYKSWDTLKNKMDIELRKRKEVKQEIIESSWECDLCGKSTFSTDYDYLVHPRLHLGCALEAENQGHSIKDQYLEVCEDVPDKNGTVTWQFNQEDVEG